MNTSAFSDMRARSGAPASRGFALIEALVALLLFSIGILGLLGLQARAISAAGDAQDRNRAALIADQCASQMQLQSPKVTMTDAAGLAGICQTAAWNDYVGNAPQGGLPGGVITVTPLTLYAVVNGGAAVGGPPLAPLTYLITVQWTEPTEAGTQAALASPSQLATQVTLLVQNS